MAAAIQQKSECKAFTAALNNDFDQPIASAVLAWKEQLASEPQKWQNASVIEAVLPAVNIIWRFRRS